MRGRRSAATALPLTAVVLVLCAGPVLAQPAQPAQQPVGRAVGDAQTGLGIVRILPNSAPTRAVAPGAEDKLPKQSAAELGFGLASAQANSEAQLAFERSVAQAAPGALAIQGTSPQAPGSLAQTAPPNNAKPATGGLNLPQTPLDTLIKGGLLNGAVHAQWSDTLGPCVGTIADAATELATFSVLNAIPTLPGVPDLTGVFDAPNLDPKADQAVVDGLKQLAGPLSTLGGVLAGRGNAMANGAGSLLSLPNAMSVRSTVKLVDIAGSKNKAVQSTSTMQVAAIKLLAGTPFELSINVVSQPTLQVTSTGDAKTSTVTYTAPVLEVVQGGKSLGKLDAANPKLDIPIGIPLPGLPAPQGAGNLPIIGDLLANGQKLADAMGQGLQKLDLGVLRLGIAQLNQKSQDMTAPFAGFQLGATARMLDLQVLPTTALGLPNLPSALAQVSLGEQVARAYAPTGGVMCGPTARPAQPPVPAPQGKSPPKLAHTNNPQYQAIPMFWTGTAMLLIGVVLVAAFPLPRPPRPQPATATPPTPAPEPAEPTKQVEPATADTTVDTKVDAEPEPDPGDD